MVRLGAACLVLSVTAACELPATREVAFVRAQVSKAGEFRSVEIERPGFSLLANDGVKVTVGLPEGPTLQFARVGYKSFGANAVNVVVAEAGGWVPRIASCAGVGSPNLHSEAALGHHFQPTLIDLSDALKRSDEVLEEIQYWPQCPQTWEVQDKFGANYRYCAHRKDAPADPARPSQCQ